jgi:hypothetical protein
MRATGERKGAGTGDLKSSALPEIADREDPVRGSRNALPERE